ncbi:hypothetical protein B0H13DRAFT_2287225 [Mycena leptocephala]|nr:hypothetical protein B0H13DRAFT_2287225 [Mycena leptocephala]
MCYSASMRSVERCQRERPTMIRFSDRADILFNVIPRYVWSAAGNARLTVAGCSTTCMDLEREYWPMATPMPWLFNVGHRRHLSKPAVGQAAGTESTSTLGESGQVGAESDFPDIHFLFASYTSVLVARGKVASWATFVPHDTRNRQLMLELHEMGQIYNFLLFSNSHFIDPPGVGTDARAFAFQPAKYKNPILPHAKKEKEPSVRLEDLPEGCPHNLVNNALSGFKGEVTTAEAGEDPGCPRRSIDKFERAHSHYEVSAPSSPQLKDWAGMSRYIPSWGTEHSYSTFPQCK